jgi:hypothetical protein
MAKRAQETFHQTDEGLSALCSTTQFFSADERGIVKHASLYTPSLSICKHLKCFGISDAIRASFLGLWRF